jgi:hypothetical protein
MFREVNAMIELLELAIAAHGGIERWTAIEQITADVSIGGGLWGEKGKAGVLDRVKVEIQRRSQEVRYSPFKYPEQYSVYTPDLVSIVTEQGRVLASRKAPRLHFQTHDFQTQWDDLDLIYFSGYAMWTYLTTPFLFSLIGFESEEIEPWDEHGETWRRLRVTFPDSVPSHNRQQVFYFNSSGILVRHDYNADVLGGLPAANYALEPKNFDGLIVPTKRRVYARAPDGKPVLERTAVAIDFHSIQIR